MTNQFLIYGLIDSSFLKRKYYLITIFNVETTVLEIAEVAQLMQ